MLNYFLKWNSSFRSLTYFSKWIYWILFCYCIRLTCCLAWSSCCWNLSSCSCISFSCDSLIASIYVIFKASLSKSWLASWVFSWSWYCNFEIRASCSLIKLLQVSWSSMYFCFRLLWSSMICQFCSPSLSFFSWTTLNMVSCCYFVLSSFSWRSLICSFNWSMVCLNNAFSLIRSLFYFRFCSSSESSDLCISLLRMFRFGLICLRFSNSWSKWHIMEFRLCVMHELLFSFEARLPLCTLFVILLALRCNSLKLRQSVRDLCNPIGGGWKLWLLEVVSLIKSS